MNTTSLLRHINALRCLRLLRYDSPLSRADIARDLGVTRATIGNAIRVLIDAGLVVERSEQPEESRIGRPGVGVALNPGGAYAIGLDISTTVLTAVLLDFEMQVVRKLAVPVGSDFRDPASVVETLAALPARLLAESHVDAARVHGVCISVPGLVDRKGRVVIAPFLEWQDVPLRDLVAAAIGDSWTVSVCNDAVALATAECAVSSERDTQNLLLVLLAEGIGGAMVRNGRIVEGAHGYAGEIGHMVMGASLAASAASDFELLAGYRRFLPFLSREMPIAEGLQALLLEPRSHTLQRAFAAWAEALAAGLLNVIHILDPERVVLGGPLAVLYPGVEKQVRSLLRRKLLHGFTVPSISVARFGADGAAIGAAARIRELIFALPELDAASARAG